MRRLFVAALWSSAGVCVCVWVGGGGGLFALVGDVNCMFVTFPCGILGQVWYLISSFPDICLFSYFDLCMEESTCTCHEMAIYLSQIFSTMLCLFNFFGTFSLVLYMILTLKLKE